MRRIITRFAKELVVVLFATNHGTELGGECQTGGCCMCLE